MIISYKLENGRVRKRVISRSRHPRSKGDPLPHDRHFSETLLKAYYARECEQGSRFRSSFTKNQIKRVHDNALARFDQTGART